MKAMQLEGTKGRRGRSRLRPTKSTRQCLLPNLNLRRPLRKLETSAPSRLKRLHCRPNCRPGALQRLPRITFRRPRSTASLPLHPRKLQRQLHRLLPSRASVRSSRHSATSMLLVRARHLAHSHRRTLRPSPPRQRTRHRSLQPLLLSGFGGFKSPLVPPPKDGKEPPKSASPFFVTPSTAASQSTAKAADKPSTTGSKAWPSSFGNAAAKATETIREPSLPSSASRSIDKYAVPGRAPVTTTPRQQVASNTTMSTTIERMLTELQAEIKTDQ